MSIGRIAYTENSQERQIAMKLQTLATNQTVLTLANGNQVLFSYNTPVAAFVSGMGYVKTDRHYSVTTSKHINTWIGNKHAPTMPQSFFDSLIAE